MIAKIISRCEQFVGWRGGLFDLGLGAVASLALMPAGFLPACLLLVLSLRRIAGAPSKWEAWQRGWMVATGWFALSLYWVSHSLFIGDAAFLFMLPFSAFGLPLLLGLFWALASLIGYAASKNFEARIIWIALCLGCAEIARGFVLSGFPWNAPGQVFLSFDATAQAGAYVGQYGLNLALFCGLAAIAIWPRGWRIGTLVCLPLLVLMLLAGWRFVNAPTIEELQSERPLVRLVQPMIAQAEKWDRHKRQAHLKRLEQLSVLPYPAPQLVIWPETAFAGFLPKDTHLLAQIVRRSVAADGFVLTGILRRDALHRLYNSAVLVRGDGAIQGLTDKRHLVPFGEYIPGRGFPFMNNIIKPIAGPVDFTPGRQSYDFDAGVFGRLHILICYEVIFPGFIADSPRPSVLVNLTNDAWFGRTAGPYQHLHQARARAIEEGLPVLRAANTGISAAIDPYGRFLGRIALGAAGALDIAVPAALAPTFYVRYRWLGVWLMIIWLGFFGFFVDYSNRKQQKTNT